MKKHTIIAILFMMLPALLCAQAELERSESTKSPELTSSDSLTIYTYDTFSSEWGAGPTLIPLFEKESGIKVNLVSCGSSGELLARIAGEGASSSADVVIGITDDMAAKALKLDLFQSYDSPMLAEIDDELEFDSSKRMLPFEYGAFSFVWDSESGIVPPKSLADLTSKAYKDKVILIDPRTSSVGLGLLLWTRAVYHDAYLDWWKSMKDNALTIADGWSSAYGLFTEGEAPIVISYTTSPVYHVLWENTTRYQALIFPEGHSTTIESIAIMKNAKNTVGARQFVDFLLSKGQKETAVADSMYPANKSTILPDAYAWAPVPKKLLSIPPEELAKNLDSWLDAWTREMVK